MQHPVLNVLVLFLLIYFILPRCSAQVFDKYGLSAGLTYSTQEWDFQNINTSGKDYTIGPALFFYGEHALDEHFKLRAGLGYMQKGFADNFLFNFGDSTNTVVDGSVLLHKVVLDLLLKISPNDRFWLPYVIFGLRGDYLFTYRDIIATDPMSGAKVNVYQSFLDEYHPFTFGALIGMGMEWNDTFYLDLEYNPALTPAFEDEDLRITDHTWSVKMGLHLSKLNSDD